ncbi:MAG: hypothetical protein CMN78_03340 [Spirochaetales bacterium]|nr:hypothetical protein [Spirochaetales bacterium]
MRINFRLLALYVFSLAIMYLAGIYFGNILHRLFLFFCLYPVFSLISLFIWYAGLDCEQSFGTNMPTKGEKLDYRLIVFNRSFLPIPSITISFENVSPAMEVQLPDYEATITAGRAHDRTYEIACPYRGEYTIGVKEVIVRDFFRMFTLKKKFKPEKFTVYPRVVELERFYPVATEVEGSGKDASAGMLPDPTLFQELREYREGDSIRHIYWKKYASTGRPFLKEYEKTKKSGVRIYLDARKHRWRGVNELEQEDVSIEILVALVKYLLYRHVHTTVIAPGWERGIFASQEAEAFDDFYQSTVTLQYAKTASPVAMYLEDRGMGNLESQTVIFLTHILDPAIFALREHAQEQETIFIMNGACYLEKDLVEIERVVNEVRQFGAEGIRVLTGESILEDLSERTVTAFA